MRTATGRTGADALRGQAADGGVGDAGTSEPLSLPALPSGLHQHASGPAQTPGRAAPSSVQHGTPSRQWGSFGGTAGLATTPHSQRRRSDLGSGEMRLFTRPTSQGVRACAAPARTQFAQAHADAQRASRCQLDGLAALQRCCAAQVPYSDLSGVSENEEENANDAYVWGTNVAIARVCKRARRFYTTFTEPGTDEPKYMAIIRQARCSLCE